MTTVAQALAYSLFLAIPAGMLVVLGVFSLVADAATVESLIDRAQTVMPEEAATLLRDSLRRSTESPGSGIVMTVVGFALAIWTTTSAATTLMKGITVAFDGTESRGFVRTRLLAGLIVAALLLAAALVVGLLILGPHLEAWIGGAIGAPTLTAWLWWTLQWPVLVVGLLLAFAVVLYLGPDTERTGWRLVTPGAVTALVVWLAASAGPRPLQRELRFVRQDVGNARRGRGHARLALADERCGPVRSRGERRSEKLATERADGVGATLASTTACQPP